MSWWNLGAVALASVINLKFPVLGYKKLRRVFKKTLRNGDRENTYEGNSTASDLLRSKKCVPFLERGESDWQIELI